MKDEKDKTYDEEPEHSDGATNVSEYGDNKQEKEEIVEPTKEDIKTNKNERIEEQYPKADYPGKVNIGGQLIDCAVLDDERRILSERSVSEGLGTKRSGSHWKRIRETSPVSYKPVFMSAGNLSQFIPPALSIALSNPIRYRTKSGAVASVYGVDATLLPDICEVWIKADQAGVLQDQQKHIAERARILLGGLAKVGIIALIDEATGYQEVRARNALNKILEAYVQKELLPWTKRFPDEYYQELFRLRGWEYSTLSVKRPRLVGKITNEIVYEKLPPGVLEELQRLNPITDNEGHRSYHHHRFLTEDIGNEHLKNHLVAIITLMRISSSWASFKRKFNKAFPTDGLEQLEIPGVEEDEDLN